MDDSSMHLNFGEPWTCIFATSSAATAAATPQTPSNCYKNNSK